MLRSGRKQEKTQAPKINSMRGSFPVTKVGEEWRGSLTLLRDLLILSGMLVH